MPPPPPPPPHCPHISFNNPSFCRYQLEEPGTHVSVVGQQMENIMRHGRPWLRYFVGPDAKAATIVGCLPTGCREFLMRVTLMMHYKKCKKWWVEL